MPYVSSDSYAILVTHTSMNPSRPETAEYYDADQVAYVLCRESGRLIVATSFGSLDLKVGGSYSFHHDQSRRGMGKLAVTGAVEYRTGTKLGAVPDRAIPHFVFK